MSDERTEEASEKKLRDARSRGEVPKSHELTLALSLLAFSWLMPSLGEGLVSSFSRSFARATQLASAHTPARESTVASFAESAALARDVALAPLALLALVAVLAHLVQTGPVFAPDAVAFRPERLDPVAGAGRLVSRDRLIDLAKTLVKLGLLGAALVSLSLEASRGVLASATSSPAIVATHVGSMLVALVSRAGGVLLAVAIADVLYQRWKFARDQRMTKDEVKREQKDADGDPHTKSERERLRREILQHDVLESVRKADVLVVNPTHLAIALAFDEASEQVAPEVLAKGQDELALRMIAAAREAGVPIMRDVPLAHGLYALELGDEIPERLYESVAAVLRAAYAEREADEGGAR